MFNTKTLFILGAGASAPYDYPLGKGLIQNIIENMEDIIFIPKYKTERSSPYWNAADEKHNVLYDLSSFQESLPSFYTGIDLIESRKFVPSDRDDLNYSYHPTEWNHVPLFKTKISAIKQFNELKHALITFDPISIDAFLRDNPSYAVAGKTMIIYSLLKKENPKKFNKGEVKDNWYSYLLNDLVSECAEDRNKLLDNQLSVITFNYDPSLDFYLRKKLSSIESFSVKNTESTHTIAQQFIDQKLEIEHVYGQLYDYDLDYYGKYSDSLENTVSSSHRIMASGSTQLEFTSCISEKELLDFKRFVVSFNMHKNIKTMYDERNASEEKEQRIAVLKNKLIWADDIIFIGFGFDRDNLNQIGFPDNMRDFNKILPGKTIRYLNFNGDMKSLDEEFKKLEEECKGATSPNPMPGEPKRVKVICSVAESVTSAYLHDFKKYLFK